MKAPKYVIAPEGCTDGFTPNKKYLVRDFCVDDTYGRCFETTDDDGDERFCLLTKCATLNDGNWIIPKDDADEAAQAQPTKPCVMAVRVGRVTVDCDDNPHEIAISDGSSDYIVVPRANIPALIEALKMVGTE